ncbi:hypothetical protein ES702_06155 [subsurface metagenome]
MALSFNFKLDRKVRKRSTVRKSNPWKSFTLVPHEEVEKVEIEKAGSIELSEVEVEDLIPISKDDADENLVRILIQQPSDNVSAGDIEKECYSYMESEKRIDYADEAVNGKARIVENMLCRADITVNGRKIKSGSWCMALRITDPELLEDLKAGKFQVAGKEAIEI